MATVRALPHQVRDRVIEILRRGAYQPGDRIPSEPKLATMLHVSRPTLREGLRLLENEHIIRSRRGSGTFVVGLPRSIELEITEINSVTNWLDQRGIRGEIKVLSAQEVPADERVAEFLDLPEGEHVIAIERIRYAEDVPVIYSLDVVPARLACSPWSAADFQRSLLAFLEQAWGVCVSHCDSTVQAVALDAHLAARIGVAPGSAWICLEQIHVSAAGEKVVYSRDYHRGEAIVFHVTRYRQ